MGYSKRSFSPPRSASLLQLVLPLPSSHLPIIPQSHQHLFHLCTRQRCQPVTPVRFQVPFLPVSHRCIHLAIQVFYPVVCPLPTQPFILVPYQAILHPRHHHQTQQPSPQLRHQVNPALILLLLPAFIQVVFLAVDLRRHHRPIHLLSLPFHHLITPVPCQVPLPPIVPRNFHPSNRASRLSQVNFLVRAHQ